MYSDAMGSGPFESDDGMNMKRRMEIIVTVLSLGVIIITALVSYWVLMADAGEIEKTQMETKGNSALRLFNLELNELGKINKDYAQWDDTLGYYQEGTPAYEKENINDDVFKNLSITQMLFLDMDGQVRRGFSSQRAPGTVVSMAEGDMNAFVEAYGGIISASLGREKSLKGIAVVEGKVCLLSVNRISDTEGLVYDGAMAIVRPINDNNRRVIQDVLGCEVVFSDPDKGRQGIAANIEKPIHVSVGDYTSDNRTASVRLNLMDMRWEPVMQIKLSYVSQTLGMRNRFIVIITLVAFVSVLAMTVLHMWLNTTFILKPVKVLSAFLDSISANTMLHDFSVFSERMLFREDASVVGRVHTLFRKIAENAVQLQRDRLSTRLALDSSMAGTWEYNRRNNQIRCDAQGSNMLGFDISDFPMPFEKILERVHPEDRDDFSGMFTKCHFETGRVFQMECRWERKQGGYLWFLMKGDGLEWDREGNGTLFSGILLDIDGKKQMESELLYLSYHDKLTGLYNRRYFEEQLLNFNMDAYMPVSIFIADINGLKLANDAFGHERGDALLRRAAECLKVVVGEKAVISRWGGDEFAILLPQTDDAKAKMILHEIKEECRGKCTESLGLHLAVGFSVKSTGAITLQHVIRSAEEKMYQDKLMESRSAHTDFLDKFKLQLHEKGIETFEHCRRTSELGLALGARMGLGDGLLEEIRQLCELHDIGKIAMPEYIFSKPDKLSELEWTLIHSHPEIGFRIVAIMQDYAHLAQSVLSHHEWYDGTGYPRGLKGREIPLAARILAISEAVAVMSEGTSYKGKMTVPEVAGELIRCKGTQFDPELTEHMISIIGAELPAEGNGDV